MVPPVGVCRREFESRLNNTCRIRPGSINISGKAATRSFNCTPWSPAAHLIDNRQNGCSTSAAGRRALVAKRRGVGCRTPPVFRLAPPRRKALPSAGRGGRRVIRHPIPCTTNACQYLCATGRVASRLGALAVSASKDHRQSTGRCRFPQAHGRSRAPICSARIAASGRSAPVRSNRAP